MDGACYHHLKQCDGRMDCRDGTDEGNCMMLVIFLCDLNCDGFVLFQAKIRICMILPALE